MENTSRAWSTFFKFEASVAFVLGVTGMTFGSIFGALWAAITEGSWKVVLPLLMLAAVCGTLLVVRVILRHPRTSPIRGARIENKRVRLVDLVDEGGHVRGRVLENCDVIGPGIMVCYGGSANPFESCEWLPPGAREWAVREPGSDPSGSVRLRDTVFRKCRFHNIGINTGRPEDAAANLNPNTQ